METVAGVEGNDEGRVGDSGVDKSSSNLSSPTQIANPVVYKLVRVACDGRLVPATEDEVMEVEDFLENEKSGTSAVIEAPLSVGCISSARYSSEKLQIESSEGASHSRNGEFAPQEKSVSLFGSGLNVSHGKQPANCREPCILSNQPLQSGPSDAVLMKPDFSMLKEEICLEKLSIRELHELFKVTFGRETTVKDKQWLKRRISMGLTNSCDVSATHFVVEANRLVKKTGEECCKSIHENLVKDVTVVSRDISFMDLSSPHGGYPEDDQIVIEKRLKNQSIEHDCGNENIQAENRAAKRIRKPTKRYIEELSEAESRDSNPKLLNLKSIKPCVKFVSHDPSEMRMLVTRIDSLGGSEVHIPYLSRIRRCRPRRNMNSLMKYHSAGSGLADRNATFGLCGRQADFGNAVEVMEFKSPLRKTQQQLIVGREKDKQGLNTESSEVGTELRPKDADFSHYHSDDNIATIPTSKGGIRRKHHRAWTLVEVMKLVDGVSRCGPGRWSEIKRLAFASYSYRTSVDLKDKWRNLLKASFAQSPADDGVNSRKQGAVPIPETILVKVRELAILNDQVPRKFHFNKPALETTKDNTSGYL